MKTQTKISQQELSPQDAINLLIEGNNRFVNKQKAKRDLQEQVRETSKGQYPFAVLLGCIDSRVPMELIFDQGIGDIFSVRVAGNIVNEDILGSIEYSCKVAGSKVVVVLGHTKCGAVTAACQGVELGNITALLSKIKPAINAIKTNDEEMDEATIEKVTIKNIELSIEQVKKESSILSEMENNGEIKIVGANYNISTGIVTFL